MIRNMCLSYYKNNLGLIHTALWLLKRWDGGGEGERAMAFKKMGLGKGEGGRAMAFRKMGLGEGEGLWLLKRWDWGRRKGYGF